MALLDEGPGGRRGGNANLERGVTWRVSSKQFLHRAALRYDYHTLLLSTSHLRNGARPIHMGCRSGIAGFVVRVDSHWHFGRLHAFLASTNVATVVAKTAVEVTG